MKKKLNLRDINVQLMKMSNKIETKMKMLEIDNKFKINYSFKPITTEELKNFKGE